MSTNFPTSLQDLDATRGSSSSTLASPSHVAHHTNEDDTIEAIQAKVGIDNSAVTTTLDYIIKSSSSLNPGHKHTPSVSLNTTGTPSSSTYLKGNDIWSPIPDRFAGTGTDGALTISSGTTTIDLASATTLVKNYTTISITGSGALAFSNPPAGGSLIILKSQGDVTLTSSSSTMISVVGMGAAGGDGGAASTGSGVAGTDGTYVLGITNKGAAGVFNTIPVGGAACVTPNLTYSRMGGNLIPYVIGAGGGGGSGGQATLATGGAGGRGGGALLIQCAGVLNFTTGTITATGAVGVVGVAGSNTAGGSGGSGGGGSAIIMYNSLTANTGTITAVGGIQSEAWGAVGGSSPAAGSGGAGGGSITAGENGGIGSGNNNGAPGGFGGNGISAVLQNIDFA